MSSIALAPSLRMPLDAVTHTFGIFGQKGSGKSSTAALFVEQGVAAGGRFVIADPTGAWWGLMHNGTGPGLPGIVFGGEHADVPLERTAGHVVAEFVVQQDEYPVVVLDMKLLRKADRTSFMLGFMETLYHDNREALHVVLDESWQFAPTKALEGGETIKLLGAVEDVVALGRTRGLGITMISQRFATLNANVREQIGTLIAHRLVGALDRKALKGWIEAQADPAREKEVMEVMAKLKTAQALIWSPAFLELFKVVSINAPTTFDSRATPKVGQRVKQPGKRAPVNLDLLRERMSATIVEAQAKDPKLLRARITELERVGARQAAEIEELRTAAVIAEVETIEVPIFPQELKDAILQDYEGLASHMAGASRHVNEMLDHARSRIDDDFGLALEIGGKKAAARAQAAPPKYPTEDDVRKSAGPPALPATAFVPVRKTNGSSADLSSQEQRVLDALAWFEALKIPEPSRIQTGFVAGYKVGKKGGGTFATMVAAMKESDLIDFPRPGALRLTETGRSLAVDPGLPRTNEALHGAVQSRLNDAQARVLGILIEEYDDSLSRIDLGSRAGYTVTAKGGGTFATLLSQLNTLALITYPERGRVAASEVLFPL